MKEEVGHKNVKITLITAKERPATATEVTERVITKINKNSVK